MACTDLGQRSFLKVQMWDGCDMILQTSTGVTWKLFKVNGPHLYQHSGSQEMPIFCSFHRIVNSHFVQVLNIAIGVRVIVTIHHQQKQLCSPILSVGLSCGHSLGLPQGSKHYAKSNLKSQVYLPRTVLLHQLRCSIQLALVTSSLQTFMSFHKV